MAQELVERAKQGDTQAFSRLTTEAEPKLRSVVRRLLGPSGDCDDVVQEALLRAHRKLATFRGESSFSTWLCSIGANLAVDHLRSSKRFRPEAQVIYANECNADEALSSEVMNVMADTEFSFDVRHHVAYCFSCVGRSLDPEAYAALVLRDLLGYGNEEAARMLGLSLSVFRRRAQDARQRMQANFESLCALVNKNGICFQCQGLRAVTPGERQGPDIPDITDLPRRLKVIQRCDPDLNPSEALHTLFFKRTLQFEQEGRGSATDPALCS